MLNRNPPKGLRLVEPSQARDKLHRSKHGSFRDYSRRRSIRAGYTGATQKGRFCLSAACSRSSRSMHPFALRSAGQVEVRTSVAAIGPERHASGLGYHERVGFGHKARLAAADAQSGALQSPLNPCISFPGSGRASTNCRGRLAPGARSSRRSPVRSTSARRRVPHRACGRCAGWCGATAGPSRNP
jgi:hypothetical protein